MKFNSIILFVFFLMLAGKAFSQNSQQIQISNADLTATDALGRKLPTYKLTGPPKPNHYVGLFYWLWHGDLRTTATNPDSVNVTKIIAKYPQKTDWRMEDYYWDEPEEGYYRSMDPWVMQHNLQLIAAAGVDFIFLDLTNSEVYEPEITLLLKTIQNMRKNGVNAPYVAPFLNADYVDKIKILYANFYKPGKYNDVWFYWKGKPLMMSPKVNSGQIKDGESLSQMLNYFTWRPTWAMFSDDNGPGGKWRFMDTHPQHPALDSAGKVEQYVVSKALGSPLWDYHDKCSSCGIKYTPEFDKYWLARETGTGIFLNEQWNRADSVQAPILLVTGWNELKAGAWPTNKDLANAKDFTFQGKKMKRGDLYFVDEFNREWNRDIQPMKDGSTDNFYYQLVARMRKYKGMLPPQPVSSPKTVKIDGNFSEWNNITPVYNDFAKDTEHRDFDGVLPCLHYTNNTGRNDIIESRTTHDNASLYFYVKTTDPITPYTDKSWMLLYIDSDNNKNTGWEGYDYVINTEVKSNTITPLKK